MKLLLIYRLARVFLHLAIGMTKSLLVFPWLDAQGRNRRIRAWARQLLAICGVHVELRQSGQAALERVMVVANHVSWLDIFVIDAVHPCRFVAKSEIRSWPILGWLAARAGTIFISRGSKRDLRKIFQGLVDKLQAGERIGFFPEGTTAAQGQLLPFHANLFEAAIDARVPVQPFAVSYVDADGKPHPTVDYIDDMTFAESLVAILCGPPVTARLVCLAPIDSAGQHRRELALAARSAVAAALNIT
ncbi:lysophospholipid acyltransferase family protein [Janthinobacterium agaricidamnosum]|uniref:1-acyl-sn-glycerol-3-phosphate acyltransferase n=1 Tax=Janthinobacterium agaricidamnosum NBRC 102515 = DSM 9628 TaxID=1349767 RepID=W0V286_9BURK|nr:lysophospholipid acyltransferase family protein [Janthinobacterium agaricidamnosum]CDG81438.1 1-acylglycerol-3-phosphate O-acyltransferases domain protein [Janthinobacterium agaricidamnosum NBRC 102515 = DSM 9628]